MFVSRNRTESPQDWTALAPAKLNLFLEVLGRRDDGFHELETFMVPIRLFDTLSWMPAMEGDQEAFHFRATHADSETPQDATNLVVKAAELLANEAGIAPQGTFTLTKRIPTQAGMGGGSSDAAAALMLANRAWKIDYPKARLARLAAQLGSDVPFFFAGGPAVCRGRGERTQVVTGLPKLHFVVVKPAETVSTREAFAALKAEGYSEDDPANNKTASESLVEFLRLGHFNRAARQFRNSFQDVICRIEPKLMQLWQMLSEINPWGAMMTGSGSAFFCLCRSATHANQVAGRLRSNLDWRHAIDRQGTVSETAFGGANYRIHGTVWTTSTGH